MRRTLGQKFWAVACILLSVLDGASARGQSLEQSPEAPVRCVRAEIDTRAHETRFAYSADLAAGQCAVRLALDITACNLKDAEPPGYLVLSDVESRTTIVSWTSEQGFPPSELFQIELLGQVPIGKCNVALEAGGKLEYARVRGPDPFLQRPRPKGRAGTDVSLSYRPAGGAPGLSSSGPRRNSINDATGRLTDSVLRSTGLPIISQAGQGASAFLKTATYRLPNPPPAPPAGGSPGSGSTVTYAYDADGNRTQAVADGVTTSYLVDSNTLTGLPQVVREIDSQGNEAQYTYGIELLSQTRNGVTRYYEYDGSGNVRALTDEAGEVTDTYAYYGFGEILARTGSTPNEFMFAAQQFDPRLGIYYMRARYMNPATGGFMSLDPTEGDPETPPSLHKYLYVHANPLNMRDPSGRSGVSQVEQLGTLSILGSLVSIEAYAMSQYAMSKPVTALGIIEAGVFGAIAAPLAVEFPVALLLFGGAGLYNSYHVSVQVAMNPNSTSGQYLAAAILGVGSIATAGAAIAEISSVYSSAPVVEPPTQTTITPAPRLSQDINVNPVPPRALPLSRQIGPSRNQNIQMQKDIALAKAQGAIDFRVDQQQINGNNIRVGINRPDLQFTLKGARCYIEYDTIPANGTAHQARISANDPNGVVVLKSIKQADS